MNIYETDQLLAEYLLFHYGEDHEILPWPFGPAAALHYPVRCVTECFDLKRLPAIARALDLGCAVGRSTFELARHCHEVVGIDYSQRFVTAANELRDKRELPYLRRDEGDLATPLVARVPAGIECHRVHFERGDALGLREDLGAFNAVLMANLIDRLQEPRRLFARLPSMINRGGQLVIASPYTWLPEFTPRENWLGGFEHEGERRTTRKALQSLLEPDFELIKSSDQPFLIREHGRKFQWSVAETTTWLRR
ncbi:Methyltransferase type 12 [Chthoniobacter flavus Ellin428]|uniref:Methyltransferase type 12 n=1 Tax=Chthoniobacter flavus Ellin428 TaxID=497964 RepID=B4D2A1_9BACT|nr:putative 4-mercaptohistidine N1-methyltransferase [Chthoniobacter flavus]EDY19341.1 Methyltransferase type 12 [Chthoniobacter flavus Ellin428]TCO90528.1 putative 4-mercaptohistidine N1-methyltransferase [Chthoniobacter flavus]